MKNPHQKPISPAKYIQTRARKLPIHDCWVNANWEENNMATVVVARKHSNGNITFGLYLVDLLCMGVKESYFVFNKPTFEYEEFKQENEDYNELNYIDYNLGHNIIFAGIDFAAEIGLDACKEFITTTQYLLEDDNDDIPLIDIECGMKGIPVIVRGPYNKREADELYTKLSLTIGVENFILTELSDPDEGDEWEDDEDDDEFNEEDDFDDDDLNDQLWYTETKELEDFIYTKPLKDRHSDIELVKRLEKQTAELKEQESTGFADAIDRLFYNHYGYETVDEAREGIYNFFDLPIEEFHLTDSVLGFDQKLHPDKLQVVEQANNTTVHNIDYLADIVAENPYIPYLKYIHCVELEKTLKINELQHHKNNKAEKDKRARYADMRQKALKTLLQAYRLLHPDYILLQIMEEENGLQNNEPSIFIEKMLANYEPVSDLFPGCKSIHSIEAQLLFKTLYQYFINTENALGIDSLVYFIQKEHPELGDGLHHIFMLNMAMRTFICKKQYFDKK